MASSHPAWSHWSDATVLDDYAMTTTTTKVTGNGTIGQIIHDLLLVELFDVKYYRDLEMWVSYPVNTNACLSGFFQTRLSRVGVKLKSLCDLRW